MNSSVVKISAGKIKCPLPKIFMAMTATSFSPSMDNVYVKTPPRPPSTGFTGIITESTVHSFTALFRI